MSVHSDDTDILLLIPPDFFLVPSDSEEDCVKARESLLVSDLLTQVNDLEGRICLIENQSVVKMPSNLQQLRHFGSADTLNTSYKSNHNSRSLQTTPMKTQTLPSPWRIHSPFKHSRRIGDHNMLESHQYINQKERDDQLLKEIHNFFKQKDKEGDLKDEEKLGVEGESSHLTTAVFNLNKVNDLLKQLEETQAEIEQKLKLKGMNGVDGIDVDVGEKQGLNKPPSTVSESPRRSLNFDQLSPGKNEIDLKNNLRLELTECDTDRKLDDLSHLLSLCKLWGSSKKIDDGKCDDNSTLKQKYQEEKCRRQHCEDLIQKLQLRLLEEQQKIAVAIKVDQEKDEAISKLTDGWNKLVSHWRELEDQRNSLGKKLQSEREKFQGEVSVACQTVKRYEAELSKALDLAHGYKEKCELSEKERKAFAQTANKEMDALKTELRETIERLEKEQSQSEKLEKLVAAKEESLNQTKSKFLEMQSQVRDLKKSLKDQQTEMEILKHEKEKLSEKLKEEKNKVFLLEQSKKALVQSNEDLKRKEKALRENVKTMTEQLEKVKVDLKEFYQEQVEKIVQEKLKEFQAQLATAEKTLQKEIEDRERKVTEMAVKQVQQIVEKHVVEVNLLEEKHNEELGLWKIKLLQAEERVEELQKKLNQYSSHKTEIAQKLQTVMETQWQEALKIITAASPQHHKSPLDSGRSEADKGLTRQNTFTMLSCGWGEGNLNKNGLVLDGESNSESPPTETPFCKEGQLTCREELKTEPKITYRIDETPQKIDASASDPLKKYIQMLLERPPGIPVDDSLEKTLDSSLFNIVSDGSNLLQWQQILCERSSQGTSDAGKPDFPRAAKGKEEKVPWR